MPRQPARAASKRAATAEDTPGGKRTRRAAPSAKAKPGAGAAAAAAANSDAPATLARTPSSVYVSPAEGFLADDGKVRCWGALDPDMRAYHDRVWGRPEKDLQRLFMSLCLQMFQTGLSWEIVLRKSGGMAEAFEGFDPAKVAHFDDKKIAALLANPAIIRNRAKVLAAVNNAQQVLRLEQTRAGTGGFVGWIWTHAPTMDKERCLASGTHRSSHMRSDFKTKACDRTEADGVHPTRCVANFTRALKAEGFKFLGETTVLSFCQAAGLMNHHAHSCFAYREIEDARTAAAGADDDGKAKAQSSKAQSSKAQSSKPGPGPKKQNAGESKSKSTSTSKSTSKSGAKSRGKGKTAGT